MAMSQKEVQAGAMRYYELLRQGVPAGDAFRQAFPNGLPTAEERAREAQKAAAKAQQKGGLASIGGLAAGALGVKAVSDAVAGKPILGGAVDKISGWFGSGGSSAATEGTKASLGAASSALPVTADNIAAITSASPAPTSLPFLSQAENVISGMPANAVQSVAGSGGESLIGLADGSTKAVESAANAGTGTATTGLGSKLIPGVGAALSAYGLFKANQAKDPLGGALSGMGLGSSIAALAPSLGLTPFGAPVLIGGALLGALTGALGQKSTKEIQAERWKKSGASQAVIDANAGRDYFAGTGGEQNRDERFLTADAIRYNPDNYNNVRDWDSWSKENQDQFLNRMLGEGLVQERKGGIYYDDDRAQQIANEIRSGGASTPAPSLGAGMGTTPGAERLPMSRQDFNDLRQFGGQLASALGRADGTINANPITVPEGNRIAYMAGGGPSQGMQAPKMAMTQPEEQQQIGARIAQALKSPAKFVPRGRFA